MNCKELNAEGQRHTMAALHHLRSRFGTWKALANALGFERSTMRNVKKSINDVSVNMAFAVAKIAMVPFDDVVSGRFPIRGTCPHCGRGPN
jgi:hypothetical protein